MNSWPIKTMSEVTCLVTDGKHGDCKDQEGSGYFFLSSKDLRDGRLHYDKPRQITYEGFIETHRRTNLEPGDILLANCGASIGRVGIAQDDPRIYKTTFQKSVSVIKANREIIDNRFLYYFLAFKSALLIRLGNGAAQPNLLIGDLRQIQVPIPPLPVQLRIAGILSAYDELIENNQRRIRVLEEMARSLYREWFVHFRFPGHDKVKMVPSPLGPIPQGWEVAEFRNIFQVKYGKTLPKTAIHEQGQYPVYGAGDVIGYYDTLLCPEKVALVTSRGNGSGTVWRTREAAFVTNNSLIIQPEGRLNYWDYSFVELLLKHSNVMEARTGSAQPQVTIENLNYVKAIVPSRPLVERFCTFATPVYEQVDLLYKKIDTLHRTRDLLLPRLLSGQIPLSC